jgi:ADP-ribosylglycohydrolase
MSESALAKADQERARGCLLGLATGDAVGTTLEFRRRGSFTPISDMVGGGPFGLQPGQWTDDTSMALCLATSLVECGGFDVADQMQRYCRWADDGYLSCTGECFDIGGTVRTALARYRRGCGRLRAPTTSRTRSSSPRISATTRTRPPPSAARSQARTTASRAFLPAGSSVSPGASGFATLRTN